MKKDFFAILFLVSLSISSFGQNGSSEQNDPVSLKFTKVIENEATPVKNQASSGTCWCFATISFLESELIRTDKGEFDLSEMFIVRNNYIDRLKDNYLRRGEGNLGPGSFAHDVTRIFENDGIVPDEIYNGLNYGSPSHNHSELQQFIDAVAEVPVQRREESEQYQKIANSILDTYLGDYPETFTYNGVEYTPLSFAESLGLDMDNYIEIASYTHWPFYEMGVLEVPDNWTMDQFYNVPIDELIEIVDYALENGYTVTWDADVSEPGFSHANGIAQLTDPDALENSDSNNSTPGSGPIKVTELVPDQEYRQKTYENFTTTDDHLMHITGIVNDQYGVKYYITKNSWGTERSELNGYIYSSENYFRGKTLSVMVHKDAIPRSVRSKLGL